jgi:EmrB/QacA subfamily drug resistance transporter
MRSRPAVTLAAMSVAQLMVMLDSTIVQVALPTIRAELDVQPANLAWIVNAYGLVLASLLLTGGALGDRFGRRRVFLGGLALFTAGSAACALATDDPQLIAARVVQGIGAAAMAPLSLSILANAFPGPGSTRAIAIWAAMGSVGFGLGPVVGGLLVEHVDWSAIFWVNVPLGVVCAGLCALGVGESRDPRARSLDLPGAALACACLSALVFALLESGHTTWLAPETGGALLASALFGIAFVAWEQRTATPMIPLGLLRERPLVTALGVTVTAYVALGGLLYLGTLLLQNVRGGSPLQAGAEWVPISVAFGVTALGVTRLTRRVGRVNAITAALILTAAGLIGIAAAAQAAYAILLPFLLLVGIGFGVVMPSVAAAGLAALDPGRSGIAAGMVNTARHVGVALGIALLLAVATGVAARSYDPPARVQTDAATGDWRTAAVQVGAADARRLEDAFVTGFRAALALAAVGLGLAAIAARRGLAGTSRDGGRLRAAAE